MPDLNLTASYQIGVVLCMKIIFYLHRHHFWSWYYCDIWLFITPRGLAFTLSLIIQGTNRCKEMVPAPGQFWHFVKKSVYKFRSGLIDGAVLGSESRSLVIGHPGPPHDSTNHPLHPKDNCVWNILGHSNVEVFMSPCPCVTICCTTFLGPIVSTRQFRCQIYEWKSVAVQVVLAKRWETTFS